MGECACACHRVIQAGLLPCPSCEDTMNRPCLGCGELVDGASYCRPCRLSGPRRLYRDADYLAARAAMLPGSCWLCGLPGADTLDHVTPLDEGGDNDWDNLRPAHLACNSGRRP